MKLSRIVLIVSAFGIFPVANAWASTNLLTNPGFEIANSPAYTNVAGGGGVGWSAAANWAVYACCSYSFTTTDLLPSTAPGGGQRMLHVTTNTGGTGPEQGVSISAGAGASFSVSVFVVQGQVSACLGPIGDECDPAHGGSIATTTVAQRGQWVTLTGKTNGLVQEFGIYSYVPNPSAPQYVDFYVDNAQVTSP